MYVIDKSNGHMKILSAYCGPKVACALLTEAAGVSVQLQSSNHLFVCVCLCGEPVLS